MEVLCLILGFTLCFVVSAFLDYLSFLRWQKKHHFVEILELHHDYLRELYEEVFGEEIISFD